MTGFSIKQVSRRVGTDVVKKFRDIPTANISDCMSRMTGAGARLRPMHANGVLVGPAFTVKTRPGDNLMVHKALDMAISGDVVIVDAAGDLTNSIIGEIMASYAMSRGLAGIVINGAIRDSHAIRTSQFPVFAAGVTHRGPLRTGPGQIGCSIAIDGMVIEPGDLVVGDGDGIVCVPFAETDEVYQASSQKRKGEQKTLEAVLSGRGMDRSWVDKSLKELGCHFE